MKITLALLTLFISIGSFAQHKIEVTSIGKKISVHTSYNSYQGQPFSSNGLLIETSTAVLLVDTAWGEEQTKELISWIKKELNKPVTHLIVTHSHEDRVTGIPVLKKNYNTNVWSGRLTAQKMNDLHLPAPDFIVPDDSVFTIDGVTINMYYPGAGHTSDNIVVYFPAENILFGGCFIKSTEATGLGNIADANLKAWPVSARKVKQKFAEAKVIVPGHQAWNKWTAIDHTIDLLQKNEAKGN